MLLNRLFQLSKVTQYELCSKTYATVTTIPAIGKKKKLGKTGSIVEKKILPVETDAHKLVKFVCGSNYKTEGQDIELKPDSEYPEWLWKLNTGKPPKIEEMNPESKEYWMKVKKMAMVKHNRLTKLRRF